MLALFLCLYILVHNCRLKKSTDQLVFWKKAKLKVCSAMRNINLDEFFPPSCSHKGVLLNQGQA